MFRQIKGQDHAIGILNHSIENDRVAQAYLFHGNDGVGKFITALYFGMALNCFSAGEFRPCGVCSSCHKFLSFEHKDFIYLFPTPNFKLNTSGEIKDESMLNEYKAFLENKKNTPWKDYFFSSATEIRKESIMMLQQRLELSINEAQYRICIIEGADQMNVATANAFLKTLEEPPARTVIILITERISMLLPTILSRCQSMYFNPLSRSTIESILQDSFDIDATHARPAALISNGNLKTAIHIAGESSTQNRELAVLLLDMALKRQDLQFYQMLSKPKEILATAILHEIINHLCLFVNDIVVIQNEESGIINIDKRELLWDISQRIDEAADRAYAFLLMMEDFKRKLDGHVNPSLILINIYFALSNLIHNKE